jgi:PBSX family phage portal protein
MATDDPRDPRFENFAPMGLEDRAPLAKAHFIGTESATSNAQALESKTGDQRLFEKAGALVPPYGPDLLCMLFEHSNSLRQNVEAYMVNIDGFGHRFEPVIDLDADDAEERVSDAIFLDRLADESSGKGTNVEFPTDEEVEAKIEEMKDEMRLEKARLEAFFRFCCLDESFISLRKKTRQDREILGSGFWEVLRNKKGDISQFTYLAGFVIRLMPLDSDLVETEINVKRTPLTYETIKVKRRFRRFVQCFEGNKIYFKELGDPRVVSALSGKAYETFEQLQAEEGEGLNEGEEIPQATEITHFKIHSSRTPYGIPRWIGTLLAVLGSRQAEEVNFLYFENKSVPPLAVLVSGGRLSKDSTKHLEDYIKTKIKGRTNFHNILVIEGIPADAPAIEAAGGKMKIEIVPLTMAQHDDALFQNYDGQNMDKVGMSFRNPRLLRGDIRDFNRATAEAALEFAEMQVYSPEREEFDWFMNRKIFADLLIKYWQFVSNAPTTRNPIDLAKIISMLVRDNILTPEEARELAQGIFNRDFKRIDELWTKIPPALLMAGIIPESADADALAMLEGFGEEEAEEEEPEEEPDDLEMNADGEVEEDPKKKKVPPKAQKRLLRKRYGRASKARQYRRLAQDLHRLRKMIDEAAADDAREVFDETRTAIRQEEKEVEREVEQVPEAEISQFFEDEES